MQWMQITHPSLARLYLKSLAKAEIEEFWCLALNSQKHVVRRKMLFRGTVDQCPIHPRDVFRFAIAANATGLILAHNHPSGSAQPSPQDLQLTERLVQASRILAIALYDHLILTKKETFSFAEHGLL